MKEKKITLSARPSYTHAPLWKDAHPGECTGIFTSKNVKIIDGKLVLDGVADEQTIVTTSED